MKKLTLAIAVLLIGAAVVEAGDRKFGAPRNQDGTVADTNDYGGYDYTAIAFSSTTTQLFTGEGVVYGFIASSNTSINDFLVLKDTDSVLTNFNGNTNNDIARVHLSSSQATADTGLGTTYRYPAPIRVKRGAVVYGNSAVLNMVTWLWNKF